jgi:O-antigen ligase
MPGSPPRRGTWLSKSSELVVAAPAAAQKPPLLLLGQAAAIALPVALLYTRAGAEILIGTVDGAFLLHAAARRDFAWLHRPTTRVGLIFWAWLVLCSAIGIGGLPELAQALASLRLFVFAAALGEWVLAEAGPRRLLWAAVAASAAWIALECWQQYLLGANVFGVPRWEDGALTGPFNKPRAGGAFVLVLFPALLPPLLRLVAGSAFRRLAGVLLAVLAVATVVLIGQRMPALLALLGLLAAALLLPRLRPALLVALLAAAVVAAATPVVSPPTYAKLVVHFRAQMADFSRSAYGLLFTRATVMTEAHPLVGLGFRGFRLACAEPRYDPGIPWLGLRGTGDGGPEACNLHPHNFYLEAASSAGLPGLVLFAAFALTWLGRLGSGLSRAPDSLRVGLFAAALVALWPLASTNEFFSVPNCGWLFLILGWGLAESRLPPPAV